MKLKKILVTGFFIFLIGIGIFSVHAFEEEKKVMSLLSNEEISVKYSNFQQFNNKKFKIYLDAEQNEYIYINDSLVGFFKEVNIDENASIKARSVIENNQDKKLEEYQGVANKAVNDIINNNNNLKRKLRTADEYELIQRYYHESYNELTYTYTKKIDSYETNDSITIALDTNGNLLSLNASNQGLFDEFKNVNIDANNVQNFIEITMATDEYANINSYDINYQFINLIENKLVLEIGIGMELEDGMRTSITLYYNI